MYMKETLVDGHIRGIWTIDTTSWTLADGVGLANGSARDEHRCDSGRWYLVRVTWRFYKSLSDITCLDDGFFSVWLLPIRTIGFFVTSRRLELSVWLPRMLPIALVLPMALWSGNLALMRHVLVSYWHAIQLKILTKRLSYVDCSGPMREAKWELLAVELLCPFLYGRSTDWKKVISFGMVNTWKIVWTW